MTFIISEQAEYEVEADNAQAALNAFLNADSLAIFPCTVIEREVFDSAHNRMETTD